jgi:hypothetical protein
MAEALPPARQRSSTWEGISPRREPHPTRDGAPLGRAGSPPRGWLSPPTARAGTVRGGHRSLARGMAGTGPPAPSRGGPGRGGCRGTTSGRRPARAERSPAPESVPEGSRPAAGGRGEGAGVGWHAERGARRAGGGTPRLPRRCPVPPGTGGRGACPARRCVAEAGGASRRSPVPMPVPNTYEDPGCQETDVP